MIIPVDKCSTFGIKKALTKSIQYLPKLLINKQLIPKINIGEAFQYLGRYFSFNMSDEHHKSELISLVEELMADIDSKPLHPKNKILLYSRYLLSKLSWHFTVSSVSKTWVTENIDSKVNSYIRKWLDIPIFYFILFYFILLSFHCTKYIYYMYNEASLQQVHTQQGKLPKTIVSYID